MIQYVRGNLLESSAVALVNTVNTVGVMGKGIALQFKEAFPNNYKVYKEACANNSLTIGRMLIVEDYNLAAGKKLIVNFPTKTHWKKPSEYVYIEQGLIALRREIVNRNIPSIAIPPLGSRNGGLEWSRVRTMIENALGDLPCSVIIYEPSDAIIERMNSERVKLTPARAMIIDMFVDMFAYGEFASVFAAEKLIYFMQRFGAKQYFKIDFKPYYYGPYSGGKVAHFLYNLNGSYIHGMSAMQNKPFDYIWLLDGARQDAAAFIDGYPDSSLRDICNKTQSFLGSFYSYYSLELIASVDYLLENSPSLSNWRTRDANEVVEILGQEIAAWSKRKERMFKTEYLHIALNHIRNNSPIS